MVRYELLIQQMWGWSSIFYVVMSSGEKKIQKVILTEVSFVNLISDSDSDSEYFIMLSQIQNTKNKFANSNHID